MKFDYLDIGTSDFGTSLDVRKPGERVLLVEPMVMYLKNLPDAEGIVKVPFAVSDTSGFGKMYFTTTSDIATHNLPEWVTGCSAFGHPHPTVASKFPFIVQQEVDVRVVTVSELLTVCDIDEVTHLQIDTEGHDDVVLAGFIPFINSLNIRHIRVEYIEDAIGGTGLFGNLPRLDVLLAKCSELGFSIKKEEGNRLLHR